jgi:hypothetical protein
MSAMDDASLRRLYDDLLRLAPAASTHPTEDDWVRFGDGSLSAGELAQLADHVVTCRACADIYRVVADVRRAAPGLAADALPRHAVARRWWFGVAVAAAAVAAVASSVWFARTPSRDGGEPAAPPVAVAPAPQTPVPSPSTPPPSGIPAWASLGEPPVVRLPAALALTMRGSSGDRQAFLRDFGSAIAPYRQGRFADAVPPLLQVAAAHPDIPETWFYLGVSQLHAGRPELAVDALARGRASAEVGAEAEWLEAVALARSGRVIDADARLRAVCAGGGPFGARACEARGTR